MTTDTARKAAEIVDNFEKGVDAATEMGATVVLTVGQARQLIAAARFERDHMPSPDVARPKARIGFDSDVAFLATLLEKQKDDFDSFDVRVGFLKEIVAALMPTDGGENQ